MKLLSNRTCRKSTTLGMEYRVVTDHLEHQGFAFGQPPCRLSQYPCAKPCAHIPMCHRDGGNPPKIYARPRISATVPRCPGGHANRASERVLSATESRNCTFEIPRTKLSEKSVRDTAQDRYGPRVPSEVKQTATRGTTRDPGSGPFPKGTIEPAGRRPQCVKCAAMFKFR